MGHQLKRQIKGQIDIFIADINGATSVASAFSSSSFKSFVSAFSKKERDALYQLTDLAILFYKRFVEKYNGKDEHHWTNLIDRPSRRA